jgi:hypothetical protein
MKKTIFFKTLAIVDPDPKVPIVSSGQIKPLALFEDHLRIGRNDIFYDQMLTRRIQDGCIHFWDGNKIVRFAIQGFISRGSPDYPRTELVNNLISAIHRKDESAIKANLFRLKHGQRMIVRGMFGILLIVILFGSIFGLFWEHFLAHPKYLLIIPILVAITLLLFCRITGTKQKKREPQKDN